MLKERIENELKEALKSKDTLKVSTLRFLKSAMHNIEIDKKQELKDEDVVAVIKKQIKQRQDSIEEFKKGNRQDLVDKEAKEMDILKSYLPQEMAADELRAIVKTAITDSGAASVKDMGRVMKEVMARVAGRADGKLISDIVKEELSKIGSGS